MRQPISSSKRSPLSMLWRRHAATTLVHSCRPPRLRGTTWSIVSACSRQYAHRKPSRNNKERRVSGGVRTFAGRRTISCRRTIEGMVTVSELERHTGGASAVAMGSARPASRRTTARRSLTSCSGSKVALSRRTRPTSKNYRLTLCWTDQCAAATTAAGSSRPSTPLTVIMRNSQYDAGGSGNQGW